MSLVILALMEASWLVEMCIMNFCIYFTELIPMPTSSTSIFYVVS